MKNFLKALFVNFILLFLIIVFLEIITYSFDYVKMQQKHFKFCNKFNAQPLYTDLHSFERFYLSHKDDGRMFRRPEGMNFSKRPVILFGCSFTYGEGLDYNQTFGYKLSKYTNRPVYNMAHSGWGLQHMLWQLKNDEDLKNFQNPEYIIYTFISNHIQRMYSFCYFNHEWYLSPVYKINCSGVLSEAYPPPPIMYRPYFVRWFDKNIKIFCNCHDDEKTYNANFDMLKKHLAEANNEIKKLYPNAKFVVIKYPQTPPEKVWFMHTSRWKELEDDGITVIDAEKLTNTNLSDKAYLLFDNHPSEAAWDLIVPKLSQKLKM